MGELDRLEPTGNGNSKPVFAAKAVSVKKLYLMGSEKQHVRLTLYDGTAEMTGVMWNAADEITEYLRNKFGEHEVARVLQGRSGKIRLDITYAPDVNVWKDSVSVQFHIRDYK